MSDWRDRAACQGTTVDFFPTTGGPKAYTDARTICATCPIRAECLAYADELGMYDGMWGGLTPDERRPRPHRKATRGEGWWWAGWLELQAHRDAEIPRRSASATHGASRDPIDPDRSAEGAA